MICIGWRRVRRVCVGIFSEGSGNLKIWESENLESCGRRSASQSPVIPGERTEGEQGR